MQTRLSTKKWVQETQPPTGNVKTNEEQAQVLVHVEARKRNETKAPNAATKKGKRKGKGRSTSKSKSQGQVATPGPSVDIKAHLKTLAQCVVTPDQKAALQAITNALELSRFDQFEHRTACVYMIKLAVPIKQQDKAGAMSIVKIGYTHDRIDQEFATASKNKNGSVNLSEFGKTGRLPSIYRDLQQFNMHKGATVENVLTFPYMVHRGIRKNQSGCCIGIEQQLLNRAKYRLPADWHGLPIKSTPNLGQSEWILCQPAELEMMRKWTPSDAQQYIANTTPIVDCERVVGAVLLQTRPIIINLPLRIRLEVQICDTSREETKHAHLAMMFPLNRQSQYCVEFYQGIAKKSKADKQRAHAKTKSKTKETAS
jgi:hypothetical protein